MLTIIGLGFALVGGVLGWSLWWAIAFGFLLFIGNRIALPDKADSINAVGIPIYVFTAWLLMIVTRFIASWLGY